METKHIIIIVGLIILIILISICLAAVFLKDDKTIQINDINVQQDMWGIYNLEGHITPEKDYSYLEARLCFYDANGVIVGKSACAWNVVNVKAGTPISIGNSLGCVCDGTPTKVVVEFYDSVYSTTPIKNVTLLLNGTNASSSTVNSNSGSVAPVNNSVKTAQKDAGSTSNNNQPIDDSNAIIHGGQTAGGSSPSVDDGGAPDDGGKVITYAGSLFVLFKNNVMGLNVIF